MKHNFVSVVVMWKIPDRVFQLYLARLSSQPPFQGISLITLRLGVPIMSTILPMAIFKGKQPNLEAHQTYVTVLHNPE